MFETLRPVEGDALLALIGAYRADPRPDKMNVGVGVYRDAHGATPVMATVQQAETQLLATQDSKSCLGLVGNADFNRVVVDLVLGEQAQTLHTKVRAVQTPGGTAALRVQWQAEPGAMRERLLDTRRALAAACRDRTGGGQFDFIAHQHGMFSLLGLQPGQVAPFVDAVLAVRECDNHNTRN